MGDTSPNHNSNSYYRNPTFHHIGTGHFKELWGTLRTLGHFKEYKTSQGPYESNVGIHQEASQGFPVLQIVLLRLGI